MDVMLASLVRRLYNISGPQCSIIVGLGKGGSWNDILFAMEAVLGAFFFVFPMPSSILQFGSVNEC